MLLKSGLAIGVGHPVRVNCNIGCNDVDSYSSELSKIALIKESGVIPDMMMDLSLVELEHPIYCAIQDQLSIPVGTVLSYNRFSKTCGLDWQSSKDYMIKLCVSGISFITIHFTADYYFFKQIEKTRLVPMTSRGGGIMLYDQKINNRDANLFLEHIDDIADIAKRYNVAISLGTTFRPATIFDACDEAHLEETKRQRNICHYLQDRGVQVMVENIGHISLDKIEEHSRLLKEMGAPIMPLGPLPTDSAINNDHIANAIGAAYAARIGCAHIINCVSRYEHSNASIAEDAIIEAIQSAKLAAHIVNLSYGFEQDINEDLTVSRQRSLSHDCISSQKDCNRCSNLCPLKLV